MKYKFSTSLLAVSLCFSGVSAFAVAETGPQNSESVLRGAGALDTQLRVLSSCARSYLATLETSVQTTSGFNLPNVGGVTVSSLAGCTGVVASAVISNGNMLTITTPSDASLSVPLRAVKFVFTAYADGGSTPFSNQATIASWACNVTPSSLFAVPTMGSSINVLARSGVTLASCQPAPKPAGT